MIKYNDYDKGVKEIRIMINSYHSVKNKPLLDETVYFDDKLTRAVMAFQSDYGLEVSGGVDYQTWTKLKAFYKTYIETQSCVFLPSSNPQMSVYYVVQAKITNLSKRYQNIEPIELTGEYNEQTRNAVKQIQHIFNLDPTGEIDCKTWKLLLSI